MHLAEGLPIVLRMALFSRFKRVEKKKEPAITVELLEEHLDSIRDRMLEIRNFEKKRITRSPTHMYWKPIDIEEAWPSCQEVFTDTYAVLCGIARSFHTESLELPPSATFAEALDLFSYLVARIEMHLASTDEVGLFSQEQLVVIDHRILQVQHATNRLHKHVVNDFIYAENAVRSRT